MKHLAWIAAALLSGMAFAHHGWSWAEDEQTELTGTIESISMSPPHPVLKVKAADGVWQVDLGNPGQTARSGFTGESASPGDPIVVETQDSWFVYRVLGDPVRGDLAADPSGIPGQQIVLPTAIEVISPKVRVCPSGRNTGS